MKILLIAGHGAGDSGAVGNGYKEADLTRELVSLIEKELSEYRVSIDVYDTSRNAFYDAQKGALMVGNYDYALEVHFNAASATAHGTEIFVVNEESSIDVEKNIMKAMKPYFTLRDSDGVKRTNFLVITTLFNQGISAGLLETCFITNANDMKVYQAHKKDIARDIAVSLATSFKLEKVKKVNKNIAVVKYMASDKKEYYLNVYEQDTLKSTGAEGYYNMFLIIGTDGARNCFTSWDKVDKVATGTCKGSKKKGKKLVVKKVATV